MGPIASGEVKRFRIDGLRISGNQLEVKAREVIDPNKNLIGKDIPPFYIDIGRFDEDKFKYLRPGRDVNARMVGRKIIALYGVSKRNTTHGPIYQFN